MKPILLLIPFALIASVFAAMNLGLSSLQTTILFGAVGALLSPIVVHRISNQTFFLATLFCLATFASFPLRKHLGLEGIGWRAALLLVYSGAFWVIAFGWKRDYTVEKPTTDESP